MRLLYFSAIFLSSCCLAWPPGPSVTPNKIEDGSNNPVAKMREVIQLSVVDIALKKENRFQEYITFTCQYQNKSKKDVRAFEGQVVFTDLFDKPISHIIVTIQNPVKAGEKGNWTGCIEFNEFIAEHRSLLSTELKNMKVQWIPSAIIFVNGSKMGN